MLASSEAPQPWDPCLSGDAVKVGQAQAGRGWAALGDGHRWVRGMQMLWPQGFSCPRSGGCC